jgi:hypothetical protein
MPWSSDSEDVSDDESSHIDVDRSQDCSGSISVGSSNQMVSRIIKTNLKKKKKIVS